MNDLKQHLKHLLQRECAQRLVHIRTIPAHVRSAYISWLYKTCFLQFDTSHDIFDITVCILDAYFCNHPHCSDIDADSLEYITTAALFLVIKTHGTDTTITASEMLVDPKKCNVRRIVSIEANILSSLRWCLHPVTATP